MITSTPPTACIHTFGCQMNKLDSELVAEALTAAGYSLTDNEDDAGVIIFNTCSVRAHAEQRVLSRVGALKRRKQRNPGLLIVVMGCFAQRTGEELLRRLPHVDLVCGTRQFPRLPELIEQARSGPLVITAEATLTAPGVLDAHGRALHHGPQAFVSVMRGCNNFCTYCIVPHVRGREESRPVSAIVQEVSALAGSGAREITLLGQNIDAYGKDINTDLAALLRAVHEVNDITRIRFVTSHPRDITKDLLATMHDLPRVCSHLHMPAQSGSSRVLAAMHRGYSREEYEQKLELVQEYAPGVLVTSDFIVGFPGETDEDFLQTLDLVRRARFQNAYIFKYSPRPGTAAARMPDNVPAAVKKERNQSLLAAQEDINRTRMQEMVGSVQEILVEGLSARDKSKLVGRTSTNLICVFDAPPKPEGLVGELVKLRITACTPLTLFGNSLNPS